MKTAKQKEVINLLAKHGQMTIHEIYINCKTIWYCHNPIGNMGNFLRKMVASGMIERKEKGVYRLTDTKENNNLIEYYKGRELLK